MDEPKEKNVSMNSDSEFSTEVVSQHVASVDSEKTPVFESVSSEVQTCSEAGPCNGVDIVSGDKGSDICVAGGHFGEGGGGKEDPAHGGGGGGSVEMDEGSDVKGLDGGVHAVGDSGAKASDLGTEKNDGGLARVTESKEEELVGNGVGDREVNGGDRNKVVDDETSQEVGAVNVEAQITEIGTKVEVSSLVEVSNPVKSKVVVDEAAAVTREEIMETELVNEGVEGSGANETGNVNSKVDGVELKEEVENARTETMVATSTIVQDSSAKTEVSKEEAIIGSNNESLKPKIRASGGDTRDETPNNDAVGGSVPDSERDSVSTKKDSIANATSKSLDGQMQDAVVTTDNKEISYPNEEGMDTDAFNENFCFSVEELQATTEIDNGSTENCYNAFADSQISHQQVQVVVAGEFAATEHKVLLNPEKDKNFILGECLNHNIACDSAQVTLFEQPGILKDQGVTVQEQMTKVETVNGSSKIDCIVCVDSATTCKSTQAVVGDEVAEMDHKVFSDPNFEVSSYVDLDGMLSSSGNYQHLQTETECEGMEISNQAGLTSNDMLLGPDTKDPELAEKGEQRRLGKCLDKSASSPTHLEQLQRVDKTMAGQNSGVETVCLATGMVTSNEILNSKIELKGLVEGYQDLKVEVGLSRIVDRGLSEIDSNIQQEGTVEEHVDTEQIAFHEGQEMEVDEQYSDDEELHASEEKSKWAALNSGSSEKVHQARYQLPPDEGELSVSDLVWGKVRSHPWWPGQIFDPSDASDKATKYHKKECFLVAYFGDRTFAWNEASLLKPFRSHFSLDEKQSNSEAFQNAVDCALEEVSRRVQLGLACTCTPKDIYDKIKFQVVENTGIHEESSTREGVDRLTSANLFEPDKLIKYMKALAVSPIDGADRLELVIAKSQLLAFYCLKGYSELPEFQLCRGLSENMNGLEFEDELIDHASTVNKDNGQNSSGQEIQQTQRSSYNKRKHNLKDGIYPSKKERSLSELMGDSWDSVDDEFGYNNVVSPSGKKRKGPDSFEDGLAMPEPRKTISLAKVSTTPSSFPKPSFKIGECIRRVASQMTGSSILKANSQKPDGSIDGLAGEGSDVPFQNSEDAEVKKATVPSDYSSLDELLFQLQLMAQDPLKGYGFLNIIVSFFSDFRDSVVIMDQQVGKRRKASHLIGGSPETFEFEDMSDTYWTDRVIQNGSEEQPPRKSRKREVYVPLELGKSSSHGSNPRKRYSDGNFNLSEEKPAGYVDENAPAELVMHFPVVDSVPSEMSLNKMFRRFGPLKESETEVDRETNRARVVFKKCCDAEAAYGSAPKFNIFGSMLVNYQLNYTITVPFKTVSIATTHGVEDAAIFLEY